MLLINLIPLPPPPQDAFNISGKPNFLAILIRSLGLSGKISLAGITGTPAFSAIFLAFALFPNFSIISADGPMNEIPALLQAFANSGFSDSRPYPGWIASAPALIATEIISFILRYDATGPSASPISYASSALNLCNDNLSSLAKIATVDFPISLAARITLMAISPLFAIKILRNSAI